MGGDRPSHAQRLALSGSVLGGLIAGWMVVLVPVIFCGFEIGQHFVNEFKSSSVMSSDFTVPKQQTQWRRGCGIFSDV